LSQATTLLENNLPRRAGRLKTKIPVDFRATRSVCGAVVNRRKSMKLINVDEFVPELHANVKYFTVSVEKAGDWWAERIKNRRHPPGEEVWRTARAIISTMVFFGIIIDEGECAE
jgi:hypothetical protein